MSSKAKRDATNVARPSTSVSAKRVSKRSSNTASKAKRDATNVARPSTSGSAKRKSKRSSNTARKAKRNVARSSTSVSAERVSERTKVEINGAVTARIQVTTVLQDGAELLAKILKNAKLIKDTLQVALEFWGIIKKIWYGSIIVDLDCRSQEKFLEFQKDFEDGKVKDAMETGFREIGYYCELELKLMKEPPKMPMFELREETVDQRAGHRLTTCAAEVKQEWRKELHNMVMSGECKETRMKETKKFFIVNPNPDVVSHGKRKEEKESNQKAEIEENPEGADNPDKEDIQPPSLKRKKASGSTEVKQEKKSGSAAKKPKLDPIGEPGTSEVSNTSETGKFKEGVVSNDDLQKLGKAIGQNWDQLARRLPGIEEDDIEEILDSHRTLPKRGYQILRRWKSTNANNADYKTLYNALGHELVGRKDLAQKYCLK